MEAQTIELNWITLKSKWVFQDREIRLNASSYSFESIKARELLEVIEKKIPLKLVNNFSKKIFVGARVKRLFTAPKEGIPYLMPIDLFMFALKPRKWVRRETEDLENWWVEPLTILITQSGTPGRCLLVNKLFKDKIVSPNVIRVVPNREGFNIVGYLYAYLNTWIGQAFLTKDQYGATVKHIEPYHVANIPVPCIPDIEEKINQKVLQAHKLREEAQELLLKAEEMIYSELGLTRIDEDDVKYFGGEIGKLVKAFEVKASELDYRLDASYHVPVSRLIMRNLKVQERKGKFQLKRLGDGIAKVFDLPTYKRIYVKPEEGYPILSGAHLRQIKLYDLKYISGRSFYQRGKNIINKYKIKKGWILTTERGTTGVSALVTEYWDGWLASHNILRVVSQNINFGYLLAYLNTEYAQYQLKSKELGAVVEVLDPKDMESILVPVPKNNSVQDKIGSLVIEAYNKKDRANQIEEESIKELETSLIEIAEGKNK